MDQHDANPGLAKDGATLDALGEQLVSIRTRLGRDLEEVAAAASVEPERLAEAEAGETKLTEAELTALADAYGVEVSAFFGGRVTPLSYLAGA